MSKKNDSSQIKELFNMNKKSEPTKTEDPPVANLIYFNDDCQAKNEPSTSVSPRGTSQTEPDPGDVGERAAAKDIGKTTPLHELRRLPHCHVQLERLECTKSHTVMVDVLEFDKGMIKARKGRHRADSGYVRMPFMEEGAARSSQDSQSRWHCIEAALTGLPPSPSTQQVENAIKKYNPKYKAQWSFDALHKFVKASNPKERDSLSRTLREIADLALDLPRRCKKAIPLLKQGQNRTITLTQGQIAALLANAFYCTFPHRNASHPGAEYLNYPSINFSSLFGQWNERKEEKLKAIFHYFKTVIDTDQRPMGLVTFERRFLRDPPNWKCREETLTRLHISSQGTIEENGQGMLQVDFACNMVGGGVLGSGLVQEEILFLINPELIAARLFTEKLNHLDCLKIIGSQQYSKYTGYSDSFKWTGPYTDTTQRDEWLRRHRQIIAIDALHFKNQEEQYNIGSVRRELNKAYCGFKGDDLVPTNYLPAVATGNWGCGAFNGDPKLKALIQLMAAAVAQRDVAYFTFQHSHVELEVLRMHQFLTSRKVTVGKLYQILESYFDLLLSKEHWELYSFIQDCITDLTSKH